MVKTYREFLHEGYDKIRTNWNHSEFSYYLFYMIKFTYTDGEEFFEYKMTNDLLYDEKLSNELGYSLNQFKNMVYGSFRKTNVPEIIKREKEYYKKLEGLNYKQVEDGRMKVVKDIDIFCSPKWVLKPQDSGAEFKPWMNNAFNDANKMYNASSTDKVKGEYEKYEEKFLKLKQKYSEEAQKLYKEKQEKNQAEYAERQRKRIEAHNKWWNSLSDEQKTYYGYGYGVSYGNDRYVGD